MARVSRRNLLIGSALFPVGAALAPLAGEVAAVGQKFKPAPSSRDLLRERYFPNVELTTHEGKKVRFYDDLIKDKIVVMTFMYAKCEGICVPITQNIKKVQNLLGNRVGRDIFFYSLTLKPTEDTPEALKHYVEMHNVKPGWTFLTGKPDDMELLRRNLGFADARPKLDQDKNNHIGGIRYGNERRGWWGMCPGQANASWIVESILWMDDTQPKTAGMNHKG